MGLRKGWGHKRHEEHMGITDNTESPEKANRAAATQKSRKAGFPHKLVGCLDNDGWQDYSKVHGKTVHRDQHRLLILDTKGKVLSE